MSETPNPSRLKFGRRMRLSGTRQFAHVYEAKVRASAGPLLVYGVANALNIPRLGLAVPRRVGTNVVRNTIKRRLREAFRLMQHDWPQAQRGYDLVINVKPHVPLKLVDYEQALRAAVQSIHKACAKKRQKPPPKPTAE